MKKYILLCFGVMLLLLTGCINTNNTYAYSYELTLKNYDEYIHFSSFTLPIEGAETRYVEITLSILDKDAVLDDVTIEYKITSYNKFFNSYSDKFYTHTYTKDGDLTIKAPTSLLTDKDTVTIHTISGKILTNTSHDIDYDSSNAVKKQLEDLLKPFNEATEFSLETAIDIRLSGQMHRESSITNLRLDPFYFSTLSQNQGMVIHEDGDNLLVHQIGQFEGLNHFRYLGSYSTLEDTPYDEAPSPTIDLSDDFFYSFENGIYTLTADTETIFNELIDDPSLLETLIDFYTEDELTINITVDGTKMTQRLELSFNDGSMSIALTFNTGNFRTYDFSKVVQMPPLDKAYVKDITDVSVLVENQVGISGTTNYYKVELMDSDYAFEIDSSFGIDLYHLDGRKVTLVKTTNPQYPTSQSIYTIKAGTYIVGVTTKIDSNKMYDFRLFPINSYETVGDMNDPILLEKGTFNLIVEGYYDYVYVAVDSEVGGLLTLTPDQSSKFFLHNFDREGMLGAFNLNTKHGEPIYIKLEPGLNTFRFNSWYVEDVLFDVDIYGITWHEDLSLTGEFSEEFIIPHTYGFNYYEFVMPFDGYLVLETKLDHMLNFPSNGFSAYIHEGTKDEHTPNYLSFQIKSETTKVYLKAGTYKLRLSTIISFKIKANFEVPPDLGDEALILYPTSDISQTLLNRDTYAYDTYNQYPGTSKGLTFTLEETSYVYVDLFRPTGLFIKNSLGELINLEDSSSLLLYLESDTYTLFFKENLTTSTQAILVRVYLVDDPNTLEDDSMLHEIDTVTFGTPFSVTIDYIGDTDYMRFILEVDSTITFSSDKSIYVNIYDEDTYYMRSFYTTHHTLNLKAGTYYFKTSHNIQNHPPIGTVYNITIST